MRTTEIRVRGKVVLVPSAQVLGRTVITAGTWPKIASVHDERFAESELSDHASFVDALKQTGLKADIFTFAQKLPDVVPVHSFHLEWDNLAVIPISNFSDWWERRISATRRNDVRKSAKFGLLVKETELNDDFIAGIVRINNETPVRQGKPFWHFNKSFAEVKSENSTYAERNIFLGAYYEDELVGVVRMICAGRIAHIAVFLSTTTHRDKRIGNAMIAKAVETCAQNGMSHLVYGQYVYNDARSSLTEFKRINGFEQVLVPRYFIPLTWSGEVAMKLGLHRGFARRLPEPLLAQLLRWRSRWYARTLNTSQAGG